MERSMAVNAHNRITAYHERGMKETVEAHIGILPGIISSVRPFPCYVFLGQLANQNIPLLHPVNA